MLVFHFSTEDIYLDTLFIDLLSFCLFIHFILTTRDVCFGVFINSCCGLFSEGEIL